MILKLRRTPGLYVVGFMGAGKTTIGRAVAEELGWHFADLDDDIEQGQQMTISEIFRTHGEPEFRRVETEALRKRVNSIECGTPTVLALGGGTFVQPQNFELVENNGVTIWLDCPYERILERVGQTSHRPLAEDPETFAQLYESRRAAYARADYRIDIASDDSAAAVVGILALPIF